MKNLQNLSGRLTRSAHDEDAAETLLNRLRLTDIGLKGSQNILPRAERMSNAHGLDVRVPLFDRRLAVASFRLPTALELDLTNAFQRSLGRTSELDLNSVRISDSDAEDEGPAAEDEGSEADAGADTPAESTTSSTEGETQ